MKKARSKIPTIYNRLQDKILEPVPMPIFIHGTEKQRKLHAKTDKVTNPRISRIKTSIETLKISAALSGSYSLSSNQIGLPISIFTIHKSIPLNQWMTFQAHQNMRALINLEEGFEINDENQDYLLDPNDFEAYINPRQLNKVKQQEYGWEYCQSFPHQRCMVRRPIGIQVSYINEQFQDVKQNLFDFHARVFLKNLDHLQGKTMTHWNLGQGNIDMIADRPDSLEKLDKDKELGASVRFYKKQCDSLAQEFYNIFEEQKAQNTVIDNHEPSQELLQSRKKQRLDQFNVKPNTLPLQEEIIVDTIRSIREKKDQRQQSTSGRNKKTR